MNYKELADESLIYLITQAHETALSELFDRYHRLVFSIAFNSTGNKDLAEEITQDVFFRVWQRAITYQPDVGRVATWLARITRNRSIDMIRHRQVRPEANSVSWEEALITNPGEHNHIEQWVESSQQKQQVRWAVSQLPPDQREALGMAYFQGLSHSEISELTGQPLGTVKTRIRLAMQKLRHLLASEENNL